MAFRNPYLYEIGFDADGPQTVERNMPLGDTDRPGIYKRSGPRKVEADDSPSRLVIE